ncbi:hypothetical protein ACJJTC_002707 [Scirpophaga incertulas]
MSEDANSKLSLPSRSPTRKISNADNLPDLKKTRGNLKGRLTQFKKYVDSLSSSRLTKLQIIELKLRLKSASDIFQRFNLIQNEIDILASDIDISSNLEYTEHFESLYFSTVANANCLIESVETCESLGDTFPSNTSVHFEKYLQYVNKFDTCVVFQGQGQWDVECKQYEC